MHRSLISKILAAVSLGILAVLAVVFLYGLRPALRSSPQDFELKPGDDFRAVARGLYQKRLIRSRFSFELYLLLTGSVSRLQAGLYRVSPASSSPAIAEQLVSGLNQEVSVTVPEDSSVYQVDKILSNAKVLGAGELLAYLQDNRLGLEGELFPDTYRFYAASRPAAVLEKFRQNFAAKAQSLLDRSSHSRDTLILASLVEKEVPDPAEQKTVAGILLKRLQAGMPLQVDATICYLKQVRAGTYVPCLPLSAVSFQADSPYNTYLYPGLPPGPIGSPGLGAINAVLHPLDSPYWFYLSDPKTQKTVFARTLEEQNRNRSVYLGL